MSLMFAVSHWIWIPAVRPCCVRQARLRKGQYCTISFNSAVTRHTPFFLTPDLIYSRFIRFFELFQKVKNPHFGRIDRNSTVLSSHVWPLAWVVLLPPKMQLWLSSAKKVSEPRRIFSIIRVTDSLLTI
ncbi:hypothetical protein BDZ97DRAFT_857369 [Flammula alnicola]|nr:hypothetical protein BDZ97DRAFT_857369 [Flammula alnicola]